VLKRSFDITVAAVALFVLFPLFGAITILIKLTSKGPVIHRSVRTGRCGEPFRMFKFRTMVLGAEHLGGLSTGKDDVRVTPLGRILRRYKLDELPQVINVIKGEMSIVGPRPEFPKYTSQYSIEETAILTVRPGLTDYASIHFRHLDEVLGSERPDEIYESRVKPVKNALRLKYVKEHNFWGDLNIIFETLKVILAK
jgi:lipopolysaccharide/colanic/teichoic acid biosynthesis glycosyltransferase